MTKRTLPPTCSAPSTWPSTPSSRCPPHPPTQHTQTHKLPCLGPLLHLLSDPCCCKSLCLGISAPIGCAGGAFRSRHPCVIAPPRWPPPLCELPNAQHSWRSGLVGLCGRGHRAACLTSPAPSAVGAGAGNGRVPPLGLQGDPRERITAFAQDNQLDLLIVGRSTVPSRPPPPPPLLPLPAPLCPSRSPLSAPSASRKVPALLSCCAAVGVRLLQVPPGAAVLPARHPQHRTLNNGRGRRGIPGLESIRFCCSSCCYPSRSLFLSHVWESMQPGPAEPHVVAAVLVM